MRFLLPLVWSTLAVALRLPITARSINYKTITNNVLAASDDHDLTVSSTRDVVYLANVTIDGNSFPLQMDTGSSDLWVDMGSIQAPNPSTITYNLTYGTGWAYGTIARGPVSFAGYEIADQAYLAFQSGNNPVLNFGAAGIIGLGLTTLSHIDSAVSDTGATWGRSLLYNIFAQNPSEPNFIAMALERSEGSTDTVQGSLGLGEVADEYASITSTEHIPLFPPSDATRWTVMLDSFAVDGQDKTVTSVVPDAPEGRAIILLDSGTTYTYAPPEVAQSIYGSVPGAVLDTTQNVWSVPCSAGIRLTIWIAGRPFDIHPLDTVIQSLADETKCIGSIWPQQLSVGASEFDWIIGTNILRSIYAIYDFGDFDSSNEMGDPYVQLLSTIDITKAAAEFQTSRGGTVNTSSGNGNASPAVSVMSTSEKLDKLMDVIPLLFAVIGANALILLTLLVIGIWLCCHFRKQKNRKAKVAPLPLTTVASSDHAYEAVPTADNEGRPSSIHTKHSSRAMSRPGSRYSISKGSAREFSHQASPSQSSMLRPTNSRDDDAASIRSARVPVGSGSGSRPTSRLSPAHDLSPVGQRSSRIPDNLIPPSPTTPTIFTTPADEKDDIKMKKMDEDMKDVPLMAHENVMEKDITDTGSISSGKKRASFRPPPPISVIAPGVRQSMASDMSNSPTVAGSEAHFGMAGPGFRDRTISTYSEHPLRQSSLGVDNAQPTGGTSPTDSAYQDARQSYYSHPNDSLSAVPHSPGPAARMSAAPTPQAFPVVPEEPYQEAASSSSQSRQEAQRAAFMAALEEPLPPPRRPRAHGYGGEGDSSQMRMSAYQNLSPSQDEFDPQMNRHSYAAPGPSTGVGTRGFIQNGGTPPRSPYNPNGNGPNGGNGSPMRRGPFLSNPSPFNPNASPQTPQQLMNPAGSPMIPGSRPASHLPPPANQ